MRVVAVAARVGQDHSTWKMEVQMGVGLVEKGLTYPYLALLRGMPVVAVAVLGSITAVLAVPALVATARPTPHLNPSAATERLAPVRARVVATKVATADRALW
jgi:hypothetical protein